MDKSFNDQELSDIMKEIEALEEEFKDDGKGAKAEASVIEELSEMDEEVAIPAKKKSGGKVVNLPSKGTHSSGPSSMSFKVSGDMCIDLHFEINGKTVALEVTDSGLTIQMEGGMTFNVPLSSPSSVKKAV